MTLRYTSGAPNVSIYLKGCDGSRFSSDRVGREQQVIEAVNITAFLLAQPILLEDLSKDRHFGERGLLARILWFFPASSVGYRKSRRPPVNPCLLDGFEGSLRQIRAMTKVPESKSHLRVAVDAQNAFKNWSEAHETRLRPSGGDLYPIRYWAKKLPGMVLRLAGVLHVLAGGDIAGEISEKVMLDAIELSEYFVAHSLVVHGLVAGGQEALDAEKVEQVMASENDPWSTREVERRTGWTSSRARMALIYLEEQGLAMRVEEGTRGRGRPSEKWKLAPKA